MLRFARASVPSPSRPRPWPCASRALRVARPAAGYGLAPGAPATGAIGPRLSLRSHARTARSRPRGRLRSMLTGRSHIPLRGRFAASVAVGHSPSSRAACGRAGGFAPGAARGISAPGQKPNRPGAPTRSGKNHTKQPPIKNKQPQQQKPDHPPTPHPHPRESAWPCSRWSHRLPFGQPSHTVFFCCFFS
jgi:hypothetical protein